MSRPLWINRVNKKRIEKLLASVNGGNGEDNFTFTKFKQIKAITDYLDKCLDKLGLAYWNCDGVTYEKESHWYSDIKATRVRITRKNSCWYLQNVSLEYNSLNDGFGGLYLTPVQLALAVDNIKNTFNIRN